MKGADMHATSSSPSQGSSVEPDTEHGIRRDSETSRAGLSIDIEDVDLYALAEQVYALLKQELWLERERQGRYQL
jgi:hypothetical protein